MSFTYGFYDSINHDRTYNARQMSEIFDGIINDGVFESIGNKFMVSAVSGMQIKVGSGRAWFNHTWTNNDSDMPLTLDAAEPLYKRIDAIVLEVNENQDTRENSIKIIKGTPASTPSKPTLINTDGIHQHILGWITINGGATAITQANIENAIGTSATPYVTAILQVTNVDQLLAQWDAQFGEWFRNIQAQMEGDVATHLQQQITDNWNSTVSMVSDASKTVLDTTTNTLIKVKTAFDTCGLVKSTVGNCVTNFYGNTMNNPAKWYYMYAWNGKLYMIGCDSDKHPGVAVYGTDGQLADQWQNTIYQVSDPSKMYLNGRTIVSPDGSAILTSDATNSYYFINDLQYRTIQRIYLFSGDGCGVTGNYEFYFSCNSASSRRCYYQERGRTEDFNNHWITLGNPFDSSNYYCDVVGVYGDTVWFVEGASSASSSKRLDMVSFASSQHTPGIQTFSGITGFRFTPLYYNASYAYLGVRIGNSLKSKALRIDLSNGTTNWSDVVSSQTFEFTQTYVKDFPFTYVDPSYYIGTLNNTSYFDASSHGFVAMDCSTMAITLISGSGGRSYGIIDPRNMYGFENSSSGVYNGNLIQGKYIYSFPSFETYRVRGGPRRTNYASGAGFVDTFIVPEYGGNVYFAGNISSAAPIGFSGSYSDISGTEILIGPPERNIVGIVS